jgi:hypothetical protein
MSTPPNEHRPMEKAMGIPAKRVMTKITPIIKKNMLHASYDATLGDSDKAFWISFKETRIIKKVDTGTAA